MLIVNFSDTFLMTKGSCCTTLEKLQWIIHPSKGINRIQNNQLCYFLQKIYIPVINYN